MTLKLLAYLNKDFIDESKMWNKFMAIQLPDCSSGTSRPYNSTTLNPFNLHKSTI